MDDRLRQTLAEILDYLLQTTKAGVDFATQQLPLVAWEQVAFARAWHTAWVGIPIVAGVIGWHYVHGWWTTRLAPPDALVSEDEQVACWVVGTIGGGCCAVVAGVNLYWALMAWVAPRVYLLNWAVDLLKKTK